MQDIFSDLDLYKYVIEYPMTVQEIGLFSTYQLMSERKNHKIFHGIWEGAGRGHLYMEDSEMWE